MPRTNGFGNCWRGQPEYVLFPFSDSVSRISRNMVDFSEAPEDHDRVIVPSGRADEVGIAEIDRRLVFTNGEVADHEFAVVFAMTMAYDAMVEIGPKSQDEVHRVYHALDETGVTFKWRDYRQGRKPGDGKKP